MALRADARDHIGKVTGSLMYYVAGKATQEQTIEAWRRSIGELPPIEETYAMRLGSFVEPFMVSEYERVAGVTIERRQEEVPLASMPDDVFATIDGGMIRDDGFVVTEFKFASPYMTRADIFNRYYDQVCLQMMCTGASSGVLVVGQGTNELLEIECLRDGAYVNELKVRICAWLLCNKTLSPPYAIPMPKKPPERWRRIDLGIDRPNWRGAMLGLMELYAEAAPMVAQHDEAGRQARSLVPDDVELVLAGEWKIARNKRGVLSITARRGG
jgi:hypothetical protein